MATLDKQVSADNDDCAVYWNGSAWVIALIATSTQAGWYSVTFAKMGSGLRFQSITIPKGAFITEAHLTFTADNDHSINTVKTRVRGEDVDDAATFSTVANYNGRPRTSASIDWDTIAAWTAETEYDSPDIKTVIQEIIDRAGWVSGNDIVIFWDDHDDRSSHLSDCRRTSYAYDDTAAKAAKLHIEYKLGLRPASIPSAESFGAATLIYDQFLTPTGIASLEAFGTANIAIEQFLLAIGIPSAEAFGLATLIYDQLLEPTGIPSAEAFGLAELIGGFITPTDYPDWVQSVNIVGQTIGHLAMNIVAQAIDKLSVDIAAQTVGNLAIDVTAQSIGNLVIDIVAQQVGVKIEGEWQSHQGNWKSRQAYNTSLAGNGSYFDSYVVPSGKTLYITGMGFACHSTSISNYDHFIRGSMHIYCAGVGGYLAMLGGESGGAVPFPTPIKIPAGNTVLLYGQNFSNMNVYHWVNFWGYEH